MLQWNLDTATRTTTNVEDFRFATWKVDPGNATLTKARPAPKKARCIQKDRAASHSSKKLCKGQAMYYLGPERGGGTQPQIRSLGLRHCPNLQPPLSLIDFWPITTITSSATRQTYPKPRTAYQLASTTGENQRHTGEAEDSRPTSSSQLESQLAQTKSPLLLQETMIRRTQPMMIGQGLSRQASRRHAFFNASAAKRSRAELGRKESKLRWELQCTGSSAQKEPSK